MINPLRMRILRCGLLLFCALVAQPTRARRYMRTQTFDTMPVTLTAMGVQFRIIDDAWYPLLSGEDLATLSQPGYVSNVVNGYGLFGSLGVHREEWMVSRELAERLGYPITVDIDARF